MSIVSQGLGNGCVVSQGYGNNTPSVARILVFVTKIPSLQMFEDYTERDLNRNILANGEINATRFQWTPKHAGLVLGTVNKS